MLRDTIHQLNWIEQNNHAVISNGPFYLENYSPESRTISIKAYQDNTYPFEQNHWSHLEKLKFQKFPK